jgi:O-antigen/teichoic acid export membrane protein
VKIIGKWPEYKSTIPSILLNFILIGYIANLINLLNYRLDIWIINLYETEAQLGYYSLASNIAQLFFMISAPITVVLQPYINSDDSSRTIKRLKLFSRINFTLILVLCVLTFFISPFALPLVYGQEFANSINSLNFLLPGILFSCATQVFALMPIKQNKVIYNLIATSIGLAITLTLDLLLIPKLGITGASIASSIAYFCIFITVMYFCFIKLGIPKGNYFILTLNDLKNLRKNE